MARKKQKPPKPKPKTPPKDNRVSAGLTESFDITEFGSFWKADGTPIRINGKPVEEMTDEELWEHGILVCRDVEIDDDDLFDEDDPAVTDPPIATGEWCYDR